MRYFIDAFRNYANFAGRATRTQFWMFTLFVTIFAVLLAALSAWVQPLIIVWVLYQLALILPSLAITTRRLHDTSRSGWWIFFIFLPVAGWLLLFILMCLRSTPGENRYSNEF